MSISNWSNSSESLAPIISPGVWTPEVIAFLTFIIFLTGVTVIGNGLIILAWFVHRPVRTPSNLLLVSLAVPDLLIGTSSIPFAIIMLIHKNWYLGSSFCQLWTVTGVLFSTVSANHLVLIALDRYCILTYGIAYLQNRSFKSALKAVAFVWLIGFCISFPYIVSANESVVLYGTINKCIYRKDLIHVLYHNSFLFVIPSVLMVYFYDKIYCGIKARLRSNLTNKNLVREGMDMKVSSDGGKNSYSTRLQQETVNVDLSETSLRSDEESKKSECKRSRSSENIEKGVRETKLNICVQKEKRAARTLGILIAFFFLTWLPYVIVTTVQAIFVPKIPVFVFYFCGVLGLCNSAVNPIIYAVNNKEFIAAFRRMRIPLKA